MASHTPSDISSAQPTTASKYSDGGGTSRFDQRAKGSQTTEGAINSEFSEGDHHDQLRKQRKTEERLKEKERKAQDMRDHRRRQLETPLNNGTDPEPLMVERDAGTIPQIDQELSLASRSLKLCSIYQKQCGVKRAITAPG
jgi:uncharacterized Fe-S radical SAM superfamily protein PflX